MIELSEADLEYLSRVRINESDSTGISGFSLKFIIGMFDNDRYHDSCVSINKLVNIGLLKITEQSPEKLYFRKATPCEIVEWKTSGKQFDIFNFLKNPQLKDNNVKSN